jgi:uncharacterized damage-inducible protein DinB
MDESAIGTEFLRIVRARFADAHRRLAETLRPLTADELAFRPNAPSNSIGNLVLHLCGHLRAGYLGEAASRNRPAEFLAEGPFDPRQVQALVEDTFTALGERLAAITPADLADPDRRDGPEGSLLASLVYSLAHTTEHVGQVIVLAKAQRPDAIGPLWGAPVRGRGAGGSSPA